MVAISTSIPKRTFFAGWVGVCVGGEGGGSVHNYTRFKKCRSIFSYPMLAHQFSLMYK